ncbi:hypothetical protein ABPG72_008296 [Tetrahymena utriculariae]
MKYRFKYLTIQSKLEYFLNFFQIQKCSKILIIYLLFRKVKHCTQYFNKKLRVINFDKAKYYVSCVQQRFITYFGDRSLLQAKPDGIYTRNQESIYQISQKNQLRKIYGHNLILENLKRGKLIIQFIVICMYFQSQIEKEKSQIIKILTNFFQNQKFRMLNTFIQILEGGQAILYVYTLFNLIHTLATKYKKPINFLGFLQFNQITRSKMLSARRNLLKKQKNRFYSKLTLFFILKRFSSF